MQVIVLGAGVIGVTSAWYLARLGHEVTVIDRQPAPAMETSRAPGGQIFASIGAWGGVGGPPRQPLDWLLHPARTALAMGRGMDPALLRWSLMAMKGRSAHAHAVTLARLARLGAYNRHCLDTLRDETGITYDDRQSGHIQLFRTERQMARVQPMLRKLADNGTAVRLLDMDEVLEHEPGLAHAAALLKGGVFLPDDQSGDASVFTARLARMAQASGVRFMFDTAVEGLDAATDRIMSVRTDAGHMRADAYVVAMGSYSPLLLRPLGLRLPVYPVKGYSLTLPLTDESHAPLATVTDSANGVSITRLGGRIRVAGGVEMAGYNLRLNPRRRTVLELSFSELFGGGDLAAATYWSGLRPCTPDGAPVIGPAGGFGNLWLNTGHGGFGWSTACASGQLIADLIAGRKPDIPALDLPLSRYA
ncbi:D-amino acid dehydrogenase [Acetobacter sp. TBRC 12305]|uniref:D-amino acid dehydrogenase n=1 Tax=Acetobacter garciniae TaxID=2817435 RepID=A0A939HML5_9PROT|nr:D-amino acid dehydrogenase [Acetobacter garciniae]MBX0343333.1 D-amino acid dehydrogenase [Acetobacter garciniae]